MARSINQIFNEILQTKNQQAELDPLYSTSQTAIYKLMFYIHAVAINIHEQYFDVFKKDLEYIKASAPIMSEAWWIDKLLNFYQYDNTDTDKGVIKIDDNFIPFYTTIDATKNIVKYCAVKQTVNSRQVNIKLAKADIDNNPIQLSNDELLSAKSFVNALQAVGLYLNVISFPPDLLKLNISIFFDGQYIQTNVLAEVKSAIKVYLRNLKFDGTIQLSKLVDTIQEIQGVNDVLITNAFGLSQGQGYIEFNRVYNAIAGYAQLDETNSIFTMTVEK